MHTSGIAVILREALNRGETFDNAGRIAAFQTGGDDFVYSGFEDFGNGHIVFMFDNPQFVVSIDIDRATTIRMKKN